MTANVARLLYNLLRALDELSHTGTHVMSSTVYIEDDGITYEFTVTWEDGAHIALQVSPLDAEEGQP